MRKALKKKKLNFSIQKNESTPTGTCLILITPDSERTMCTFLGVAGQIKDSDIDIDAIKNSEITFFEGYLLMRDIQKRHLRRLLKIQKKLR